MKIAIDTGPLKSGHKVRGIGVHTREVLSALESESKKIKNLSVKGVDFSKSNLSNYDIVHYQHFHPYFLTLPESKNGGNLVVTIHDLIPLIYPDQYAPGFRGKMRFKKQRSRIRKVDAVITISETSKKDICRFLKISPEKVHVVHLAQRKLFKPISNKKTLEEVRKKYKLPKKFILYVGDVNYNKNILDLIEASEKLKVPLVICGKHAFDLEAQGLGLDVLAGPQDWFRFLFNIPHPEQAHHEALLDKFRSSKNILRLGYVPDEDLVSIYNLATVYCQPSFYEGFGLPLLEAMACGLPVVASKIQAHVEVAEGAALFANLKKRGDLATKIRRVFNNKSLQEELVAKGKQKVKEYSWSKTAKDTLEVYKNLNG